LDIENERDAVFADVSEAYQPFLEALANVRKELAERNGFIESKAPQDKEQKKKYQEIERITRRYKSCE
jgi:hypothetical protein